MILVNNRDKIEWEQGMTIARLLEKCGFTAHQLNVFVNDDEVRTLQGLDTEVSDSDRVSIVPAMAGGR